MSLHLVRVVWLIGSLIVNWRIVSAEQIRLLFVRCFFVAHIVSPLLEVHNLVHSPDHLGLGHQDMENLVLLFLDVRIQVRLFVDLRYNPGFRMDFLS